MKRYEYRAAKCPVGDIQKHLDDYSALGWRLHTLVTREYSVHTVWERERVASSSHDLGPAVAESPGEPENGRYD